MWSPDSVTDASTLLLVITRTKFLSALVITSGCLQHLRGLTTSLQGEAKDMVQAVPEIKTLTSSLNKSDRMLTPTTVSGLKQSVKYVMRWGLHHQCPGYVIVNITEQACQHLIPLNTFDEYHSSNFGPSSFWVWKTAFQGLNLVPLSIGNRRSCNCVQCGDESGGVSGNCLWDT